MVVYIPCLLKVRSNVKYRDNHVRAHPCHSSTRMLRTAEEGGLLFGRGEKKKKKRKREKK